MPVIPGGDLTLLRSTPHTSRMYLLIQSPLRYTSSSDTFTTADAVWFGVVRTAPAVDPITSLEVTADAAAPGVLIYDGMTILISSTQHGRWERGIVRAHGDQTIAGGGADDDLYIAVSSDLSDVQAGDFIVVLDEFRPWTYYPKITEAGGDLTWYKNYGFFRDNIGVGAGDVALTWAQLGANDAARAQASMPAVPIMGPHAVKFIDPDIGSVTIDFDWSDSYATAPGAAIDEWESDGETDHAGTTWTDNVENPAAKTYSTLSGLRGFRTWLELGTDATDPIVEFRRGVRFVFTLRRPNEAQSGDPADAQPITDFEISTAEGSFDSGSWRTSIRVFSSQASEYEILPGALVILFTEDVYGSTSGSIGPDSITLADRTNIVMIGHIADNSLDEDSESGDVTFDVVSAAELMRARENYPIPIEDNSVADEWFKTPSLNVDRAAHHYICWHTNLRLIADFYQSGDTKELKSMDFLAGDAYNTIDAFVWDRIFARLLCDRFERFKIDVNLQMEAVASGTTLFTLATNDWIGNIAAEQIVETPASIIDLGGLYINTGLVTPFLSHAPGDVSKYRGVPEQMMSLALSSQANLNTLSGRLLAYRNNEWPRLTIQLAGNWRVFDIWPQEYVVISEGLVRHTFSSDNFIVRDVSFQYNASTGVMMTTIALEMETDGPAGTTVVIPEDLPDIPWQPPRDPPKRPPEPGEPGGEDLGRRMVATPEGVFVTDNIGAINPVWYGMNTGFVTANDQFAYGLARDSWRWWTETSTTKRLWVGTRTGVWFMDDFPNGTWAQQWSYADLMAIAALGIGPQYVDEDPHHCWNFRFSFGINAEGYFTFICGLPGTSGFPLFLPISLGTVFVVHNYGIATAELISQDSGAGPGVGWNDVKFPPDGIGYAVWVGENQGQFAVAFDHARLWLYATSLGNWELAQYDIDITFAGGGRGLTTTVSIPYGDGLGHHIFWGSGDTWRVTHDSTGSWDDVPDTLNDRILLGTAGTELRIFLPPERLDADPCQWTQDGGITWNTLPLLVLTGGNNDFEVQSTFTVWTGDMLQSVLAGGTPVGASPAPNFLYYWQQGMSDWVTKDGNLFTTLGATIIYDIDRDSTGAP